MKRGLTLVELLTGLTIVSILIALLLMPFLGIFGGFVPNYSKGSRTGVLLKVSEKGLIWRSWECELQLSEYGLRSSKNQDWQNVFAFSTRDAKLGEELDAFVGKRIVVHYTQYLVKPIKQGTSYTVKGFSEVKGEK